ncbi:flagellar biosynthetic protein FliR [Sphingomonas sp. ID0503]|uniref:flagellar biosynthetic protein FliR n=1 Tax=Sphingomonas sp. ID0503 TaxID=3399691 RepID=UPI003AFA151A
MLGLGVPDVEPMLWTLIFVMVRVGAAFTAAPVFGAVGVPVQVRIILAGAIAVLVLNAAQVQPPTVIFSLTTMLAVVQEALVGLALGFVVQIAFAAPLLAGEAISGSMGLNFAATVDPMSGAGTQAIGQFLSIIMILLFLAIDGHLVLTDLVVRSYQVLPPGQGWLSPNVVKNIATFGGYAFLAGFLLALPVGFTLLCLNLVVGMMSRSAPSLNLFAVGLPASLVVGIVTVAVAFPAMGEFMGGVVREGLNAAARLVFGG